MEAFFMDSRLCYLSGLYLSDGWVDRGDFVCISLKDEQLISDIGKFYGIHTYSRFRVDRRTGTGGSSYQVNLRAWMSRWILRFVGKKDSEVCFWESICLADLFRVLRGLFDGDGCLSFLKSGLCQIGFVFNSVEVRTQNFVRYCLESMGITRYYFSKERQHSVTVRILNMVDQKRLAEVLLGCDSGFSLNRKDVRLREVLSMSPSHTLSLGYNLPVLSVEDGLVYSCIKEASVVLGMHRSGIERALRFPDVLCGGKHWRYHVK
jgi:hypothetical protein